LTQLPVEVCPKCKTGAIAVWDIELPNDVSSIKALTADGKVLQLFKADVLPADRTCPYCGFNIPTEKPVKPKRGHET